MAGLTSTGIEVETVSTILADIESDQLANIDANLNVNPDDILGILNGIFAAKVAEANELLEEIYHSAYPDTASGQSLSYIAALTGAIRQEATTAELTVTFIGTVGTVIPAGTRVYNDNDPADSIFVSATQYMIEEHGASDWVIVPMFATVTGSDPAFVVGTDTAILEIPITGVSTIVATSFVRGLDEETDSQLRVRREQLLALPGASTVDAIRAEMLTVTGVDSCTVFENPTSVTDANGLPPYSIEVLVYSATAPNYDADEVAAQIWASKPAGTQTYGGEGPIAVTDSSGNQHDIYYSEPTTVRLYVAVTLTTTTDGAYSAIGDAGVAGAIEQWALTTLTVGRSVYASDIINVVADLAGVQSVSVSATFVEAGDATPDQVQWIATPRQLGTIDADDVTVTST